MTDSRTRWRMQSATNAKSPGKRATSLFPRPIPGSLAVRSLLDLSGSIGSRSLASCPHRLFSFQ